MCAAYTIQGPVKNFIENFKNILIELPYLEIDSRVVPYRPAPVVTRKDSGFVLSEMSFSLVPSWSKEKKVKFATHNARVETVLEKPTWKKPFLTQRALVPMTYFVEPVYENELAGNMVQFYSKQQALLWAAGIYDVWLDQSSGELLSSFSILTTEPPEFISKVGHDRCPIFLKEEAFGEWLSPAKKAGAELMETLMSNQLEVDFGVRVDRALKPGWEKRK